MTTTPHAAVTAWWQAMQDRDTEALFALALPDYLSSGGPMGRSVGRTALIAEAAEFFADARIDDWSVDDFEIRRHGDTAVCSYRWSETGTHLHTRFALCGLATDVLIHRDGTWLHQAHHVSPLPGAA
ncbi:nuclear transport factor 2 family protein [Nonomuraea sp. NPDC048916]|uniref:nuclear transport factor 2 family protein n=1 Tax=Nonomuraea sp. NPDC048916 TaxID=3154232 RepID=UPI0033F09C08